VNEAEELEVSKGAYVEITLSDTGAGIASDLLDRVFEPFFTTKERGKGTGLGLAMVYGFVRQSGGQVRISSILNKGTTVRLFLPALIGFGRVSG
jgi:signal transduction histidine kinase